MRVLWFTNGPLPAVMRKLGREAGGTGHWMSCMLESIRGTPGLELAVAAACPGLPDMHFTADGVTYYVMSQPKLQSIFSCTDRDLARSVAVVEEQLPDLIHIHGSERFYGLLAARGMVTAPVVISLQGFLQPYVDCFFGAMTPGGIVRSHRLVEFAAGRGLYWRYREMKSGVAQEREILTGCGAFMGRTEWDHALVMAHNPDAAYYHVGEILRPEFFQSRWDLDHCERHTVVFTNAGEPRRGAETLLRALPIVLRTFPDARIRLGGELGNRRGYHRMLRQMIDDGESHGHVELLGYLDAGAMARELRRAHAFVLPSYAENSPNSLCEAMLMGMPCVATHIGGVPSLAVHARSALLVPPGDPWMLADSLIRIFRDDEFAASLGRAAHAVASQRHEPATVAEQLLYAYENAVTHHGNTYRTAASGSSR